MGPYLSPCDTRFLVKNPMIKAAGRARAKAAPAKRRAAAKAAPTPGKRRKRAPRLSPESRRGLILDAAAKMVLERGIAGCTPEAVAAASNVSRPLVYKYFPTRDALLGALLQREFDHIRGRSEMVVPPEAPSEIIRGVYVRRYMEYVMERGALMRALINDAGAVGHTRE